MILLSGVFDPSSEELSRLNIANRQNSSKSLSPAQLRRPNAAMGGRLVSSSSSVIKETSRRN